MKKPRVTSTNHLLPFDQLSPDQFERLCLWLVHSEGYSTQRQDGTCFTTLCAYLPPQSSTVRPATRGNERAVRSVSRLTTSTP
ncbi:MAG TPA: hypothetical protein VJX67_10645 [Blastocatellia bacterium]|nr:hypothetical protein [Blastocatellia bacterium]